MLNFEGMFAPLMLKIRSTIDWKRYAWVLYISLYRAPLEIGILTRRVAVLRFFRFLFD